MGSSPQAPDPMMSMFIQQQANNNAAQQQQKTNMVSQSTPYGSLNYASDPSAPSGYRATQTLTPGLQNVFDQSVNNSLDAVKGASTLFGNNRASMTGMSPQFNPMALNLENASKAPTLQNNDPNLSLKNNNANLDLSFDANARRLADLNKSTLDPYWKQQENDFDQKMAERGLVAGGVQYDNAYRDFGAAKSNAYNQANLNAYNTVTNNATSQFNNNNAVTNQNNQNAATMFDANNNVVNQNNSNALNQYNAQNAGLGINNQNALNYQNNNVQNLGASLQAYNAPFNTYAALNGGGQVNQPVQSIGLTQTPQASIAAPDYMGMASSNYGQQSANNNAFNSGLFGLGGSLLGGFGARKA